MIMCSSVLRAIVEPGSRTGASRSPEQQSAQPPACAAARGTRVGRALKKPERNAPVYSHHQKFCQTGSSASKRHKTCIFGHTRRVPWRGACGRRARAAGVRVGPTHHERPSPPPPVAAESPRRALARRPLSAARGVAMSASFWLTPRLRCLRPSYSAHRAYIVSACRAHARGVRCQLTSRARLRAR